ncbi:flagellin [Teichococcus aestuarii]|uniref:flagellin n=1 Tax=Teichococcus aestuarii TaxID=568898 RepID=UPI00360C0325
MLANLDAAPAEADVAALLQGTVRTLRAAADGVNGEAGALGNTEQRTAGVAAQNREVAGQLELQVGALEAVDPAEAFVRMQAIQTQLQASYKSWPCWARCPWPTSCAEAGRRASVGGGRRAGGEEEEGQRPRHGLRRRGRRSPFGGATTEAACTTRRDAPATGTGAAR